MAKNLIMDAQAHATKAAVVAYGSAAATIGNWGMGISDIAAIISCVFSALGFVVFSFFKWRAARDKRALDAAQEQRNKELHALQVELMREKLRSQNE